MTFTPPNGVWTPDLARQHPREALEWCEREFKIIDAEGIGGQHRAWRQHDILAIQLSATEAQRDAAVAALDQLLWGTDHEADTRKAVDAITLTKGPTP